MNKTTISFFFMTALVGCGTHAYQSYGIYDRADSYLNVEPGSAITFPQEMDSVKPSEQYTIPLLSKVDLSAPAPDLLPPGFDELPADKNEAPVSK